jgi:hypothetical protein
LGCLRYLDSLEDEEKRSDDAQHIAPSS